MKAQTFNIFTGIAPILDPRNLDDKQGQEALNCDVLSGSLVPIKKLSPVESLDIAGAKTIYKHNDEWLAWANNVNVCRSPVFGERYNRLYYSGDGAPKVRGLEPDASGDPTTTVVTRNLGVPRPSTAPAVAVSNRSAINLYFTWTMYWEYAGGMYQVTSPKAPTTEDPGRSVYWLGDLVAVSASTPAGAMLQIYGDAYSDAAKTIKLGRVFASDSYFATSSDLYFNGAKVYLNITQRNAGTSLGADISYSSSSIAEQQYTLDRYYVYTLVSDWGEEGPPSLPSSVASVDPTEKCVISGIPALDNDFPHIIKARIYRTVAGASGTLYKYLTELTLSGSTSAYTDETYDNGLKEAIPSQYWEAPPAGLKGLVALPGGFMAGFVARTIYFSFPYQPHAWPSRYAVTVEDDIVTMAVSGNSLYALTKQQPVIITGNDPASMSVSIIPSNYAAVSERGVLVMNDNVIYASTIGLIALQGFGAVHLTKRLFSQDQWDALTPETMFLVEHQNRIFMCHSAGAYIIYPMAAFVEHVDSPDITRTIAMVRSSVVFYAARNEFDTDTLYVTRGSTLHQWEGSADNETMQWRSRDIFEGRPFAFSTIRLSASAYPVTVRFYAKNEVVVQEIQINDDRARKLPVMRREKSWSIGIEATSTVRELSVGTSIGEI